MTDDKFGNWETVECKNTATGGWMAVLMWPLLFLPGAPTNIKPHLDRSAQAHGEVHTVTAHTGDLAALRSRRGHHRQLGPEAAMRIARVTNVP